jgi:hypothetical protein
LNQALNQHRFLATSLLISLRSNRPCNRYARQLINHLDFQVFYPANNLHVYLRKYQQIFHQCYLHLNLLINHRCNLLNNQ